MQREGSARWWLGLVVVAGCTRSEDRSAPTRVADAGSVTQGSTPKVESTTEPCGKGPCRTYDEAVREVKRYVRSGSTCTEAATGKCGLLRYVVFSDGFGGYTEYFDDAGVMKGRHGWADYNVNGSDNGAVPMCEKLPTQIWCKNSVCDAGPD